MKTGIHTVTFILLVIGGLNWLLVGINPSYDVVAMALGGMDGVAAKIVYILVGLSAVYEVATHKKNCKNCTSDSSIGMGSM